MVRGEIQNIIDKYNLQPHPEGGYYRETYRSEDRVTLVGFDRFPGERLASTAIIFMLTDSSFSAFHRIKSDECWHFYFGGTLLIHMLYENGKYNQIKLGSNPDNNETFQAVIPTGAWFAAECINGTAFSLVGCTVSPGFDFRDFELAKKSELSPLYPEYESLINRLCRQ